MKRLISFVLAFIICVLCVSCGNETKEADVDGATTTTTTATTTTSTMCTTQTTSDGGSGQYTESRETPYQARASEVTNLVHLNSHSDGRSLAGTLVESDELSDDGLRKHASFETLRFCGEKPEEIYTMTVEEFLTIFTYQEMYYDSIITFIDSVTLLDENLNVIGSHTIEDKRGYDFANDSTWIFDAMETGKRYYVEIYATFNGYGDYKDDYCTYYYYIALEKSEKQGDAAKFPTVKVLLDGEQIEPWHELLYRFDNGHIMDGRIMFLDPPYDEFPEFDLENGLEVYIDGVKKETVTVRDAESKSAIGSFDAATLGKTLEKGKYIIVFDAKGSGTGDFSSDCIVESYYFFANVK